VSKSKDSKKIPIGGTPLTDNPFAALGGSRTDLPPGDAPIFNEKATEKSFARPYRVAKTRKGRLPIALEKRARGKVVTVVKNISGDSEALLKELKRRCGAGGVVRDDSVEIQGDHRERIDAYIEEVTRP
jgi:translation initiation factor 1